MEILIVKLGAIGDVIRTTSILSGLKSKYKDYSINWITQKESFDILRNNNLIDKIYLMEGDIENKAKNKEYDLIINLEDSYEACELVSKINKKKIIGSYLDNGKITYTEDSSLWFDMGLVSKFGKEKADSLKVENKRTYQEIIYKILNLDYKNQLPVLNLSKEELEFRRKFAEKNNIENNGLVIGINTGAGGRWQDKKLSIEKTAELIDKITKEIKNCKIILFGGAEEKERNNKIKELSKTTIIDARCDNSLMEFASLIDLCNILVSSDSLAMHIGIALKKKVVCFFYVTSAAEIELYNNGSKIIGKGKSYCSYEAKCKYPPKWDINEIVNAIKSLI